MMLGLIPTPERERELVTPNRAACGECETVFVGKYATVSMHNHIRHNHKKEIA